jgi:hypothetical protein
VVAYPRNGKRRVAVTGGRVGNFLKELGAAGVENHRQINGTIALQIQPNYFMGAFENELMGV